MNGLTEPTAAIFEQVSKLQCIKEYTLIGGTALALHLQHRLSEDLDFCRWRSSSNPLSVDWFAIKKELSTIGQVSANVLDFNQCDFVVSGVKVSFYANNKYKAPESLQPQPLLNNLKIADVASIGVMKMEVMSRRTTHRDYYDMYAILASGVPLSAIIAGAGRYSLHTLHTKTMLAILTSAEGISVDPHFSHLHPAYSITLKQMEEAISEHVRQLIVANRLQTKKSLSFALKNIQAHQPEEDEQQKSNANRFRL
jgi:hypothetical protein